MSVPQTEGGSNAHYCFFNSKSDVYSRREVITLVALGALSLILAFLALGFYLFHPAWMAGAHVLTVTSVFTALAMSILLIAKCSQNGSVAKGRGYEKVEKLVDKVRFERLDLADVHYRNLFFGRDLIDSIRSTRSLRFSGKFGTGEFYYAVRCVELAQDSDVVCRKKGAFCIWRDMQYQTAWRIFYFALPLKVTNEFHFSSEYVHELDEEELEALQKVMAGEIGHIAGTRLKMGW